MNRLKNIIHFYYPREIEDYIKMNIIESNSINTETYLRKYLYIVHKLYWEKANNKMYEKNGIPLNMIKLKEILGTNSSITSSLIQNLIEWKIIIRSTGYTIGSKSYSYKLDKNWEDKAVNRNTMSFIRSNCFIFKMIKKREERNNNLDGISKYQFDILKKHLSITEIGIEYLQHKYEALSEMLAQYPGEMNTENVDICIEHEDIVLFSILLKEYYVYRPEEGNRLYSNITSLKTNYRQFILIDNKPIINTDMKNSQVVFGTFLIQEYLLNKVNKEDKVILPTDFNHFKELVIKGEIYEFLAKKIKFTLTEHNRREFKQKFFKQVWYGRTPKKKGKFYIVFESLFPNVTQIIEEIKKEGYTQFPIKLQKLEAGMMLDVIAQKLIKRKIKFLTIHDSFVLNNHKDRETVEKLIKKEFEALYKSAPELKSESIKEKKNNSIWQSTYLFKSPSYFENNNKNRIQVRNW